ncbi:hypothetical protein NIES2119_25645 [[Phormidium ambiguum] IAM M-71]|uniref:DUF4278 domain-containing protein n=1 Tax=[Phormidium ambiguum] IAM M-71 TaxID=454136 RepID=A0A1U7I8G1_9CYAN|nr:DUF4278 domain-containing protein [Phormidium ambiguum]OKH32668.1 hypothetical protein NIES2119_25645 [Phormidium ambiguum IAM M-71]
MKLLYRGNHYESASQKIETVKTEIIACFRGQKYQINRPALQNISQKSMCLKYRGVPYLSEPRSTVSRENILKNQKLIGVS